MISDLCVTEKNVGLAVLLIWLIVGNCELTVSTFMFYVNIIFMVDSFPLCLRMLDSSNFHKKCGFVDRFSFL